MVRLTAAVFLFQRTDPLDHELAFVESPNWGGRHEFSSIPSAMQPLHLAWRSLLPPPVRLRTPRPGTLGPRRLC